MSHKKKSLLAYIIITIVLAILYFVGHFYIIPTFIEVDKQKDYSDALNYVTAILTSVVVIIPRIGEALDID